MEESDEKITFEDLCRQLKNGMNSDQACEWAAQGGLRITEEQRDYLERDLEVFDTSALLDVEDATPWDESGVLGAGAAPTQDAAPKKPEVKHLTNQERKNIILGVFIILAVAIAFVRFITT